MDENLYEHVKDIRETLMRLHVTFENFVTVASPHCGTSECLSPPLYNLAWYLSKLQHSKTIQELIHVDAEHVLTERLLNVHHLAALAPFRHRTLFANTTRDFLVGFGTSSLIFEPHVKDQVRMMGIQPDKVPCAAAFKDASVEVSEAIYLPLSNKHYHKAKHDKNCQHGANSNDGSGIYANNNSTYNSCNKNLNLNTHDNYENNFSLNASMTDEERLANHRFLTLPSSLHELHDALLTRENTQMHLDEHDCKQNFIDFDLSNINNGNNNYDSNKNVYNTENRYEHKKRNQVYTRNELQKKNRSKSNVLQQEQQQLHNQHHHHPYKLEQGRRARSGLLDNNELQCYNYHFPYSTSLRETRDNIFVENESKSRSNVSSDNRVHKISKATDNESFDANCIDELQHNSNYNNIFIGHDNNFDSERSNNNEITVSETNDNSNNSRSYNKTNITHSASMSKHNTYNTINQNNEKNNVNNNSNSSAINKKNKKMQIMEPSVQNSLSMRSGLVRCQSNFIGPIESTHTIADIRAFYNAFHSFTSASPSSESSVQSIGERNLHSTNNINNINKKFNYKNATSTVDSVDSTHHSGLHDYTNNNRGKRFENINDNNNMINCSECNNNEPNSVNHSDLQADNDTFIFDNDNNSRDEAYDVDNNDDSFEFNSSDEDNHVEEPIFNCDDPSFAFTFSSMNVLATLNDEDNEEDDINKNKTAIHKTESHCTSMKVADNHNNIMDNNCSVQENQMPDQLQEDAKTHNDLIKQSVNTQLDDMMTISSERKSSREEYEIQSTQFHDATEMYDNDLNNDEEEEYEDEGDDDDDRYIETVSVASKQSEMHHVHCLPHSSLSLSSSSPLHVNNNNTYNKNSNDCYKETDTPFTINANITEREIENEEYCTNDLSAAKMKMPAIEAKDKKFKLSTVTSPSKSSPKGNNNDDIVHYDRKKAEVS